MHFCAKFSENIPVKNEKKTRQRCKSWHVIWYSYHRNVPLNFVRASYNWSKFRKRPLPMCQNRCNYQEYYFCLKATDNNLGIILGIHTDGRSICDSTSTKVNNLINEKWEKKRRLGTSLSISTRTKVDTRCHTILPCSHYNSNFWEYDCRTFWWILKWR